MASVTGFTAERMLAIENTTIVDARVEGDNLILVTREGTEINAGDVRGPLPEGVVDPLGDTIPMRTADGRLKVDDALDQDDATPKWYTDTKLDPRGTELGGGIDLNEITMPGIYTQTSNVEASSGINYPAPYAGVLEVFNNRGPVSMVWQRYSLYGSVSDKIYYRAFYSSWYPWHTVGGDTGWVSAGLAFGLSSGWSVTSYSLRKVGTRVTGAVVTTYTGPTVTSTTDSNIADLNGVITMPAGWRTTAGAVVFIPVWREGFNVLFGRANPDGTGKLDVVHGSFNGQQLLNGAEYTFMIDYYTD